MADCKWMRDEFCINTDYLMGADYRPVSELCEGCAFWDEPMTEQPCCGCIDGCNAEWKI